MAIATPPTGVSNGELIRWAFEQLNNHDVGPLKQFWHDGTVERFPDRTCHGADEIARYFEDTFAAVPDMHMEVVALAEQGDDVFVQWKLTGNPPRDAGGHRADRQARRPRRHRPLRDSQRQRRLELRRLRPDAVRAADRDDAAAGVAR
jgi:hypothetical protein